jgi:PD-(D/E)XK nuclease superfamily
MSNVNMSIYHDAGYSSSQIRSLETLLTQNPSIHWITLNPNTGIYEMVLDNSLMACFRTCPSLFINTWVEGWASKGGRSWILDFGTLFHKMIEEYYKTFRSQNFNLGEWAVKRASEEWHEAQMNYHAQHKEFISMNGLTGFCTLLAGYSARFNADNERLRIIGTEIAFGRNKEVPLGRIVTNINYTPYLSCFLAGRIDVLVDDRTSICPLDHKTKGNLRNDPSKFYEIDEGPTGYVYAVNSILPKLISSLGLEESLLQRNCNKIIMNYISKAACDDPNDRFKRLPIMKTQDQLESYRKRMLLTAEDIFHALIRYASTGNVTRSTDRCTGIFGSDCAFLPVHRQSSKENELQILNNFFNKKPIWNTENV